MNTKSIALIPLLSIIFTTISIGQARNISIEYFVSNSFNIYSINESYNMMGITYEKIHKKAFYKFGVNILEPKSFKLNNNDLDYYYSIKAGIGYTLNHGKRFQFPLSFLAGWMKFKVYNISLSGYNFSFKPSMRFYFTDSLALTVGYNLEAPIINKVGQTKLENSARGNFHGAFVGLNYSFRK